MTDLLWLIPLLPFIGFVINGVCYKIMPKTLAAIIASGSVAVSFIISLLLFFALKNGDIQSATSFYYNFITVGNFNVPFSLLYDQLSALMLLIVTGVGFLIHVYSAGYMHDDEGHNKFFAYLNLFVFFMLLLVLGANYVIMFIGWEGVGLCSYLLIGFWFGNDAYNDAAKKAFVMNRIGDLGFLLGIFMIIVNFGTVDYAEIFTKAKDYEIDYAGVTVLTGITLLLFVGATGKSAQIPLYTWLPDAMAGPTPVSALIHAATMVTAGIYMVARSNILYTLAPVTMGVMAVVGIATAIFAATIGLKQNDIKKVLAYSTVSQLGYMFLGLGVGTFTGAFFHVMTHAFFKALLFLGAGSVIHAMSGEQDVRNMGALSKKLPITFITFIIATIAIAGIPPFAGFFSKDEILAKAFEYSPILWGFGVLGAGFTSYYMFRLLFLTFFGSFRGTHEQEHHLHESPLTMTVPLMVLAVLSMVGGFINIPEVLGGTSWLKEFLAPVFAYSIQKSEPAHALSHDTEYMLMGISVGVSVVAIALAFIMYIVKKSVPASDSDEKGLARLLQHKYYVDELYIAIVQKPLDKLSSVFYAIVELKFIDALVNISGRGAINTSALVRKIQTGNTGFYVFAMVIGIIIIIGFTLV
ncbi:MAG: NADH-quinone oxidoreductase subunit L [Cytophagales bacterium]|nr:NADH-quinone oxidoreductase subunit L [Cytophagales bacterium]